MTLERSSLSSTARVIASCAIVLLLAASWVANAQEYPSKTVRIIVPQPPGGGNDLFARIFAAELTALMKQQFIVDNRPGAGGNIGMQMAAKTAPDGYTLILGHTGTLAINPALYRNIPYDSISDFTPISLVAVSTLVLVTHPSLPVRTVKALIALAKAKPDSINMASAGNGTVSHLAGEYFKAAAAAKLVHVPYRGTSTGLTAVLSGESQLIFAVIPPALAQVRAGRLRALATSGEKRSSVMPDVPTVGEAGVRGFEASLRYGFLAPARTPEDIVSKVNAALRKAVDSPDMSRKLAADGADAVASTPQEFARIIVSERAKWAKVVQQSGAKVD